MIRSFVKEWLLWLAVMSPLLVLAIVIPRDLPIGWRILAVLSVVFVWVPIGVGVVWISSSVQEKLVRRRKGAVESDPSQPLSEGLRASRRRGTMNSP